MSSTAQAHSDTYTIRLPQFEGPFDLLLFFIERDELDIHDIPIARITDDFLGYMRQMEAMNIDLASEFILVAATLCRIKAKLLLPRKPLDEEGNAIDPREELVQRLLEYKRYKSVLADLRRLEEDRARRSARGYAKRELQRIADVALVDVELESLSLFKLLRTYERVMDRFRVENTRAVHRIVRFSYTIEEQQAFILSRVRGGARAAFTQVFEACQDRIHAIVTFLALLELLNAQRLRITEGLGPNNFYLEAA